jgi:hypothetical protein
LRGIVVAVPTALCAVLLSTGGAAYANVALTQVSSDPYTDAQAQHRTEVEPDTFAFGNTIVSAFQVGRVSGGGSSNIGFATSSDGGSTWTHGFLPGITGNGGGPYGQASDASVAFDARHNIWLVSSLGIRTSSVDVLTSRSTGQELGRLRQHDQQPVLRPLLHRVRRSRLRRRAADEDVHRRRRQLGRGSGHR